MGRWASLAVLTGLAACAPRIEEVLSGCDPLDPSICAMPYPSSYFLEEADTVTGVQVALGERSLPLNRDGVQLNPTYWNRFDGFSTATGLITWFPDLSVDNLPSHVDPDVSVSPQSNVMLVDVATGTRVPLWAELDLSQDDPEQRPLLIRPMVPLEFDTTYAVGLRNLQHTDGTPVSASEAFAQLRDDTRADSWDVESRRDRFDTVVFPALEAAGMPRSELTLAWDFHTVSRQGSLGRAEWIRDDVVAWSGDDGPPYTITSVTDEDCDGGAQIGRTIEGTFAFPNYMQDEKPITFLTRGDDGMPFRNGEIDVEFLVRVPCSVIADPKPSFLLQYGHGLLGSIDEARTGWLSRFANDNGWVVFGVSFTGMKEEDYPRIALMVVTDPSDFAGIPERSHQGLAEFMGALRMMRGAFATDDAVTFDGTPVIDTERFGYYGISQGGIMGGAYVALSPDIERGVLGVPGAPYSLLLSRSHDFDPFFTLFREKFVDRRDISLFVHGLSQQVWDPTEAGGWLYAMNRDTDNPKDILIQAAIGDSQVTTLGAHIMARAYGASTVAPQTRPIWGVSEQQPGFSGSAIVEWQYSDVPDEPIGNLPASGDHDTHECPRRQSAGQRQVVDFLEDGVVNQHCDGACIDERARICG